MNILFLLAHPDDEAFGPAGTIAKLSKTNKVTVVSLCNGARPGNEHVSYTRQAAFVESCRILGAEFKMYNQPDCSLEYKDTLKQIEMLINYYTPEVVYTHNISDIHVDHRLVAEACMVACRPKLGSSVNELYMCELPASTEWSFGQIEPVFVPNVFVDITEYINVKKNVMQLYSTEVYEFPDARSISSMEAMSMCRGKQVGVHNAEAFKLVFKRD